MGRGKKKRVAKRRRKMFNRNAIRVKMGKTIFFTLTHCSKKLGGVSNKYNYKANMHKLCFVGVRFYNVKYQASIITNCNFRNANLIGIDFFNCNLRGTSFKNTSFKNVVFYNCNLRDADFKDAIFGNMDSQLFLGGTEPTTLKDLSQFLGKETIDMYNTGESRGNNPSYSMNYQKSGKDLMTVDEIAVMDGDKCILQLRGVRPFLSDKYDVTQHPLYKETGEYDERNKLDIQRFLHQGIKVKSGEMFDVVRI